MPNDHHSGKKLYPTEAERKAAYGSFIHQFYSDQVAAAVGRAQEDALKAAIRRTQHDADRAANQRAENARQQSGQVSPGWICSTCHFANEASNLLTSKCAECGTTK